MTEAATRTIRSPEFARRLEVAVDNYPHAPPLHRGRYSWLQEELKRRFDESVSIETCRKWFAGEARPRPDKVAKIAQLLGVDVGWLSTGVDPEISPRERKLRDAMVDGVVNVVAGIIQMDGGHPAFPDDNDQRAREDSIDLYAVIRGANYGFHVTLGTENKKSFTFPVPAHAGTAFVLGVVKEGMSFKMYEITPEVIATGTRRGSSVVVDVDESDLIPITSFEDRL